VAVGRFNARPLRIGCTYSGAVRKRVFTRVRALAWIIGGSMHGRIIRIVRRDGEVETYVIAEPDKAKAVAKLAARAANKLDRVEPIGRASLDLLKSMGLAPGEFSRA
jgi:hypothetical protein